MLKLFASRLAHPALVWVGGTVGTSARYALGSASPDRAGWPATTLLINIGGALALGALLQALTGAADSGWRRTVRLTLGTGLLGGFTTYSALVAETVELVVAGQASVAVGYALATVLLGGLASWVGLSAVKALQRTWGRR